VQDVRDKVDCATSLALLLSAVGECYYAPECHIDVCQRIIELVVNRFNISYDDIDWEIVYKYTKTAIAVEYAAMFPYAKNLPKPEYQLTRTPTLVKAKVTDYIELLRQLAIGNNVKDIGTLFYCPDFLQTCIKQEKSRIDEGLYGNTTFDFRGTDDVDNMRV
jgi:hypothetical protein